MEIRAGEDLEENDVVYIDKRTGLLYKVPVMTAFGLKDTFGIIKYTGQISCKEIKQWV